MVALLGFAAPVHFASVLYYVINKKGTYSLFKGYEHFLKSKVRKTFKTIIKHTSLSFVHFLAVD